MHDTSEKYPLFLKHYFFTMIVLMNKTEVWIESLPLTGEFIRPKIPGAALSMHACVMEAGTQCLCGGQSVTQQLCTYLSPSFEFMNYLSNSLN